MTALCDRVDQLLYWLAPTVEAEAKRSYVYFIKVWMDKIEVVCDSFCRATVRFMRNIVAKCFGPDIECALTGSFPLKVLQSITSRSL